MKKTKKFLAVFLAAVLLVGTGVNNNSLSTVNAETGGQTTTVSGNESTLNDAQQAFVDAVGSLDKDTIINLANAYKDNANEETESAFYAEYDKVEGFDTSAYELYQALSEDEKSGIADSYTTLKDIMDSVASILDSKVSDEASTYLNEDTVATVENTEYTADRFEEATLNITDKLSCLILKIGVAI